MIRGIGVDVVDIARFADRLAAAPGLRDKLFTPQERNLPLQSLAARFAAKEAIAKALGAAAGGAPGDLNWQDATITRTAGGPPGVLLVGTVQARANQLGISTWHLSLTHDGGIATAMVIAES